MKIDSNQFIIIKMIYNNLESKISGLMLPSHMHPLWHEIMYI